MKKIELEDLKVLETYLKRASGSLWKGDISETASYIEDALAEIKRWKENGKSRD